MILTPYYLINVATKNNKIDDIGLLFLKPVRIAVIAYSNTTDHVLITHFYCLKSLIFCDLWYCICFCFTEVKWQFFTRHWIIFPLFLWITSRFHHGILEPPTKMNLCHCQFVLMSSNIHFFLGPLLIGIPSHRLFVSCSRLSPSTALCRTRHPPTVADYHDTPVVTGGLHPLLDIALKNKEPNTLSLMLISLLLLNCENHLFSYCALPLFKLLQENLSWLSVLNTSQCQWVKILMLILISVYNKLSIVDKICWSYFRVSATSRNLGNTGNLLGFEIPSGKWKYWKSTGS